MHFLNMKKHGVGRSVELKLYNFHSASRRTETLLNEMQLSFSGFYQYLPNQTHHYTQLNREILR